MRNGVLGPFALAAVLAAGPLAPGLPGQSTPDLSGTWILEPATSSEAGQADRRAGGRPAGEAPASGLGSGWGDDLTIAQDRDSLVVTYAFFARGDMQPPLRFAFALDGSPTTNTVMMGRGIQRRVSSARWEGESLVITTVYHYPDAEDGQPSSSEVVRRLTLESPTSLAVETTRAGVLGGPATTTRTVYTRS